jgi:hypothetical protein
LLIVKPFDGDAANENSKKTLLIVVLAVFCRSEFAHITIGGIVTADTDYGPLLKLNLSDLEQPILHGITGTNIKVVFYGRIFWLVLHGLALGLSLLVLRKVRQSKFATSLQHM